MRGDLRGPCVRDDHVRKMAWDVPQTFREHFSGFQDLLSLNSTTRESETEHFSSEEQSSTILVRLWEAVLGKRQNPKQNRSEIQYGDVRSELDQVVPNQMHQTRTPETQY